MVDLPIIFLFLFSVIMGILLGFIKKLGQGSNLIRLSENAKSENFGIDNKGLMTRKSVKMPILGQPVIY